MRISALQEYGLRCLVQLARAGAEPAAPCSLSTRQIAEREGLTLEYTGQILAALRRVGLVTSVRGVYGGFRLGRPAREITVGLLFRHFDGPIGGDVCDHYTGTLDVCRHATACNVAPVWAELSRRIYGFLDGITVADIAEGAIPTTAAVVPVAALRRR